jgi:hypothetical protein
VRSSDPLLLPADPLPDLRRARGRRLPGVSVLVDAGAGDPAAGERAARRAEAVAAAVAERHEVVVTAGPDARLRALESPDRLDWVVLANADAAGSLAELGRCLAAAADHDVVVGRRLAAPAPRRRRRGARPRAPVAAGPRRGAGREQEHPFVLVRRDLARRIARTAGGELPAVDLAVLAVLMGAHVALVRVHDRAAHRPPEPSRTEAGR